MSKTHAHDVVVAGHICLDIIPDLTHVKLAGPGEFYTPGKLLNSRPATLSTGGPVSNTGLALVKLGIDAALMGKVGDDPFGQMVRMLLSDRWGVTEGLIVDPSTTTSYTVVIAPAGFDRMFLHSPGANDTFCAEDIDYDLVAEAKLFHFGYPPLMQRMYQDDGAELIEIFRRVHSLGVTTSLDMSLPDPASASGKVNWAGVLQELIPHVDIYLPSAEETLFMLCRQKFDEYRARSRTSMLEQFSGDDLHDLSGRLLEMGGKVIGIKCGPRGFYARSAGRDVLGRIGRARPGGNGQGNGSVPNKNKRGGNSVPDNWVDREFWQPTYHIDHYASATGSGDSSIAGFLAAYLRGLTIDDTLRYATATGASNVTAPDALSGIKPWNEMTAELEAGWRTDPLRVAGQGWRADGVRWIGPGDSL